eukprot:12087828-Alexandrium_andersonii.AAC.1
MSASLVGSEMCIRDRCTANACAPVRQHAGTRDDITLRAHARARESAGAVSYTHLTLPTICSV